MIIDDFFWRAMIAGVGISIIAGPLGCFVVWKRMSFLGDTMAHSALLGVAFGILVGLNIIIGVFIVSILIAIIIFIFHGQKHLSNDSILSILSHGSLAIGVLIISTIDWVRIDFMGFLFGDILSVTIFDIYLIYIGLIFILFALIRFWRPLIAITFNTELAQAEGLAVKHINFFFMLMIAGTVAISIKIVGILLLTSLLVIPVSTARKFCSTPEQMAFLGSIFGIFSVWFGLETSFYFDTPSGPSIVIIAILFFLIVNILPSKEFR